MAKPDMNRNTDVPATIAGFYYQIIIACREICKDFVEEVGVETGADVVIIDKGREKSYIEAKLHTDKFSRFSSDVTKTIYNFYNDYKKSNQIKQMLFTSNVGIGAKDRPFFCTWGLANAQEIEYVQKAVLRKSIELHKECKQNYEKFCLQFPKESSQKKREELEKEVFEKKTAYQYGEYAVENEECTYEEFIGKLKFEFCDKDKKELLTELEEEAEKKIIIDYQNMPENVGHAILPEDGAKCIFCSLVKIFFDCVVENRKKGVERNISVAEYQKCLQDYYRKKAVPEDAKRVKQCLERLAFDENEVTSDLNLEEEGDRLYLECYSKVKKLFLIKLQEEKGNLAYMERYLLKSSMASQQDEIYTTMIALLNMLAVILYEEKMKIEDIKLFLDGNWNNLEIIGKLQCCYKRAYGSTRITNFVRDMVNSGLQWQNSDKQVVVAEAKYFKGGRPCENEELSPEVFDFTQTEQNFKYYEYFCSFNYKCTDCLERNSAGYKQFWEGGGGLCKKV